MSSAPFGGGPFDELSRVTRLERDLPSAQARIDRCR
jgi:hypothetical protein